MSVAKIFVLEEKQYCEWLFSLYLCILIQYSEKRMEIDMTTPALLFSAISLIMLAYTNRFLSYAQLVRTLKEQYTENPSKVTAAQIANLRKRLYLTRAMQVTGIGSLLLCVVSMFTLYIQQYLVSVYIFGLGLVLLIISLAISVYEIYISVKALELHLNDMGELE